MAPSSVTLFVGTYTKKESHVDGHGEGIYVLDVNIVDGSFSNLKLCGNSGINPTYFTFSNSGKHLYVVNEHDTCKINGVPSGEVSSFLVDDNNSLTLTGRILSNGTFPCHIRVDKFDKYVIVANYGTGSAVLISLFSNGSLNRISNIQSNSKGSGIIPDRQEASHFHSTVESSNNSFVYAADLGDDKIFHYQLDSEKGILKCSSNPFLATDEGAGPRKMVFHTTLNVLYILNELNSTVITASYDSLNGHLVCLQTSSTLPQEYRGNNLAGDVQIEVNGKFLYVSNRGHNSIASFRVDPQDGSLVLVDCSSCYGKTPRSFTIANDLLIVGNQDSNTIVSFRIDFNTGKLNYLCSYEIPSPACLKVRN